MGFEAGRRGMGQTVTYSGMIDSLLKIVRNEGLRGLFKGLSPGLIKASSVTSINFWLYEYVLIILSMRHKKRSNE